MVKKHKEYILEIQWVNSKNETVISILHLPYKKAMSIYEIEEILKKKYQNGLKSWKAL